MGGPGTSWRSNSTTSGSRDRASRGSCQWELRAGHAQLPGRRAMTTERGALQRSADAATRRTGGEPADQEPGIEGVAGAGRIARRQMLGGDLEAEPRVSLTNKDGRALGPTLHDGHRRELQEGLAR